MIKSGFLKSLSVRVVLNKWQGGARVVARRPADLWLKFFRREIMCGLVLGNIIEKNDIFEKYLDS